MYDGKDGEIYFLIQVLEKGAHMNHNYPEHIMAAVREWHDLERDDTSRDEEFQQESPETVFDIIAEYEGIIGYTNTVLGWIAEIFKVKLSRYGEQQTKEEFVQGMKNILDATDGTPGPLAMRVDQNDKVYVLFEDGEVVSSKE